MFSVIGCHDLKIKCFHLKVWLLHTHHCSAFSGRMRWSSSRGPVFRMCPEMGCCCLLTGSHLVCSTCWLCLPCPYRCEHPAGPVTYLLPACSYLASSGVNSDHFTISLTFFFSEIIFYSKCFKWKTAPAKFFWEDLFNIPGDWSSCLSTLSLLLFFKNPKRRFKIITTKWIVSVFLITGDSFYAWKGTFTGVPFFNCCIY